MTDFNAIRHYQLEYQRLASSLPGDDQTWMNALRQQALAQFVLQGFPERKNEEWKYTSTLALSKFAFHHELANSVVPVALPSPLVTNAYRCVFVDGHFQADLSTLPKEIQVQPLSVALKSPTQALRDHLGSIATTSKDGIQSLNAALMQDGLFIHIPANFQTEKAIEILHFQMTPELASHYRHLILAESGSRLHVIEVFYGEADQPTFTNAVTEIAAGPSSQITHTKIIEESHEAYHVGHVVMTQAKDSVTTSFVLTLSGGLVRSDTSVHLAAQGALTHLYGLYLGSRNSHIDHHTEVHHTHPRCTSQELYKGILQDKSRAVFNGKVVVYKDAQKTDATQTNKNLLLSRSAEVDTKPQLEIFADDVKCSHGATVGQIDPESLFYLQSRGLSHEQAQELLMQAFIADVIEKVEHKELRNAMLSRSHRAFMPIGALR